MASLRQICSIVQITSRPQHTNETNIATFVRGKRKHVEKSLRERPAQGTTTIINEFFYRAGDSETNGRFCPATDLSSTARPGGDMLLNLVCTSIFRGAEVPGPNVTDLKTFVSNGNHNFVKLVGRKLVCSEFLIHYQYIVLEREYMYSKIARVAWLLGRSKSSSDLF